MGRTTIILSAAANGIGEVLLHPHVCACNTFSSPRTCSNPGRDPVAADLAVVKTTGISFDD
jgi:hypothetical protein